MTNTLLSIVIPTYNRPEKLSRTLCILIPQVQRFGVRVKIIDNASEKKFDLESLGLQSHSDLIQIVRNTSNVGVCANICKCFELCDTEWMWLLSDDDLPDVDAVRTILNSIELLNADYCFINYSTSMFEHEIEKVMSGLREFSDALNSRYLASNLLFISTSIYNIKSCKPYISHGYQMSDTQAPHLAILISALGYGGLKALYCSKTIVKYEMPSDGIRWSMLQLFCGISSLYNFAGLHSCTEEIVRIFLLQCRWHKFGYSGIILIFSNCEIPVKWWFLQLMKALVLSSAWVRIQCLCMILVLPLASISPLRRMLSNMFSKFDSLQKIKNSV